jgi:predicted nucleic acid-binding protein
MQIESLDTNILIRLILNDIPEQRKIALKLLEKPNTRYNVADLALHEVAYVINGETKGDRKEVSKAIRLILALPNVNCNRVLFSVALPIYESHPSLSFNDCCLATYAAIDQAEPLWTFDKKLATQSPTAKLAT